MDDTVHGDSIANAVLAFLRNVQDGGIKTLGDRGHFASRPRMSPPTSSPPAPTPSRVSVPLVAERRASLTETGVRSWMGWIVAALVGALIGVVLLAACAGVAAIRFG